MKNSFQTRTSLTVGGKSYEIFGLKALEGSYNLARLPFSMKILLENLLRMEDDESVSKADITALLNWDPKAEPDAEICFTPARVVLQDFTGVPAVVDLAAMRDAMLQLGGDPTKIEPWQPAELVIDHSIQVDKFASPKSFEENKAIEYGRNQERYAFLRWGQNAFKTFKVVPPATGIVHQVNLEFLARVVFVQERDGKLSAYPDSLVGTDSHTTMINGIGVLGWGVGGIEAEAAMLGQPVVMLLPQVVGFKLSGKLPEGATATDLVLTVVQMLRKKGVVGKFVEFFGPGLASMPLADRATIANMAPEYGATCGIFPIDEETLAYMRLSGRSEEQIALVEAYAKAQGLFHDANTPDAEFSDLLELDLSTVEPSLAGPKRPQDRITLKSSKTSYREELKKMAPSANGTSAKVALDSGEASLQNGAVVIAAITSCTNTSNPAVMLGAGLVAKKAAEKGLTRKPWVKTSLAPGSKVVMGYLEKAGLVPALNALGFDLVGYGCTTCIGNSGPLPDAIEGAIKEHDMVVTSVLSGNRNFEGRVHPLVKMNFLASPPLVVAYAVAGTMDIDLYSEPLGTGKDGQPVFLKDIWPTQHEIAEAIRSTVTSELFRSSYASVFEGDEQWRSLPAPTGDRFQWDSESTYIQNPPYFVGMTKEPAPVSEISGAKVLCLLGDSVTTDHISPAGNIEPTSPAGQYLQSKGVPVDEFNSYGSRRGNHEVMMRGTFANVRLKNQIADGREGAWTKYWPTKEIISIYDAAMQYKAAGTPLVVLAGKEYGTGSSRDWAAKGPALLGVKAVIVESFERIHRSNLVGMGVLPLMFKGGDSVKSLGLDGTETFSIPNIAAGQKLATVTATRTDGSKLTFEVVVRIDTPKEFQYYQHGGILQYAIRQLL